jgi:hypothetical protein
MSKQQKGKTEKQRHRVQNSPADPAGVVNGPRDSGSQTNAKNKIERPFLCDLEIRISFGLNSLFEVNDLMVIQIHERERTERSSAAKSFEDEDSDKNVRHSSEFF